MQSSIFVHTPIDQWQASMDEGQLAVDVIEAEKEIVVVAPMAGADARDIDVVIHHDLLTIRGSRQPPKTGKTFLHQECFWGKFSRTLVLPVEVKGDIASAEYANGVLVVHVPKRRSVDTTVPVRIIEE